MYKPTKEQILQALDDLEEGKPISADLRGAVNQYQRSRVEAHLDQEVNADGPRALEKQRLSKERFEEWFFLICKRDATGLTEQEQKRLSQLRELNRTPST